MDDKIVINIEIPADQLRKLVEDAVRNELKRPSTVKFSVIPKIDRPPNRSIT